jgi:hypothetical protein
MVLFKSSNVSPASARTSQRTLYQLLFFRSLTVFRPHLAPHREQYLHYKPKSHKRKSGACISTQFHRKSESADKLQKKSEIFCFTKSCLQSYSSKERDKLAVWRTDRHDLVNSSFAKNA